MIAIILLLLFIAPAWSLAQETEELSLVEAARRERERRASITVEVKILTNRDVEEMEGLVSTAAAPEPVAEASQEGEAEESSWEKLFDETRLDLQTAENRGLLLELQMEFLKYQLLGGGDGGGLRVTRNRIEQQLQEAQIELEINRQEIEAARAAYEELQKTAEAEGLFPGEIRDLMGDDS